MSPLLQARAEASDGRLVVRYPIVVVLGWIGLAIVGLWFGFAAVVDENTEGGYIGFGLSAICVFVASFAARPVVTADRTGMAVLPLFGSRTSFHWGELRAIGVRHVRAARGRGQALVIEAADDREVKVDGLWVGLTGSNLQRIEDAVAAFATAMEVARPAFGFEPEPERW